MSGGHFNYSYHHLAQFCDQLESDIRNNHKKDQWGYAHNFREDVIYELNVILSKAKELTKLMKHVEWLYSGDDSEETFLKNIKE